MPCADLLGQAAIVALHALRDPQFSHTAPDVEFVAQALRGHGEATAVELVALAAATGSTDTLRPLLDDLGVPVPTSQWSDPEPLRRWQVRTQNAGAYTTSWLIELRHTPWRRRPQLVRRALFLPTDELYSVRVGLPRTNRNTARLHAERWGRALRYLPGGLRAARTAEERIP